MNYAHAEVGKNTKSVVAIIPKHLGEYMDKWEIARYLIDAKKCVDSVLYIADNGKELSFFGLKALIDEKRNSFYINCCAVIDHTIAQNKNAKRSLCNRDSIVSLLYKERDKNSAHKDEDYIPQKFEQLNEIADQMKMQLIHIKDICSECIPDNLTLDFVSHDKVLFRSIHKLLAQDEELINSKKYPKRNSPLPVDDNAFAMEILNDTIDLRSIPQDQIKEYGVVINNGICFYEGIQERQDAIIRFNLLFKQNAWCSVTQKEVERHVKLRELGVYDDFDIIQPLPTDPTLLSRIMKILDEKVE